MFYHSGYPMSTDVEFRFPWIQYDKCDTPLLWVEVDLYVKQWVEYTMLIFNIWWGAGDDTYTTVAAWFWVLFWAPVRLVYWSRLI